MATSGSYNFGATGTRIINKAMSLLGIAGVGFTISGEDQATALETLNMLVKSLQAEGIGLWKNTEAWLFPSEAGYSYSIGPSGTHCSSDASKTELAAAAASGASTITVDSDDDMTNGDYIGVELDDGSVQWTTINGVPSANVVTLTATLTGAAAVDNHVYNYTAKLQRPVELVEARKVMPDGSENTLVIISRAEYMALATKTSTGSATQVYYDPILTNGKLYVWPASADVQEYIKFTCRIPIEDFDSATNDPDFPQEWLLALSWNLAVLLAPEFGKVLRPDFLARAEMLKQSAAGWDTENASVFFKAK